MLNIIGLRLLQFLLWVTAGVVLGVLSFLASSHIPFIVPGVILGTCGGFVHVAIAVWADKMSSWQVIVLIALSSMVVTVFLIPETRNWSWVIPKVLVVYYVFFSALLYFIFRKLLPYVKI